jgi:hypothetical protein
MAGQSCRGVSLQCRPARQGLAEPARRAAASLWHDHLGCDPAMASVLVGKESPQMLHLRESDSLACDGSTMGEHMLTQLLTKDQIDAHLEKLDRQIKALETDGVSDIIQEPNPIQDPSRTQSNELETNDIRDIIEEPRQMPEAPRIQASRLETNRINDIIDEPKRIQEPPRVYEKVPLRKSRFYRAGEFIVSAFAIIVIILAVTFTALITATLREIIQQFSFRQYVSVTILAGILFCCGYFLGYSRRE